MINRFMFKIFFWSTVVNFVSIAAIALFFWNVKPVASNLVKDYANCKIEQSTKFIQFLK